MMDEKARQAANDYLRANGGVMLRNQPARWDLENFYRSIFLAGWNAAMRSTLPTEGNKLDLNRMSREACKWTEK